MNALKDTRQTQDLVVRLSRDFPDGSLVQIATAILAAEEESAARVDGHDPLLGLANK